MNKDRIKFGLEFLLWCWIIGIILNFIFNPAQDNIFSGFLLFDLLLNVLPNPSLEILNAVKSVLIFFLGYFNIEVIKLFGKQKR